MFRGLRPYWAVDVSDKVYAAEGREEKNGDEIGIRRMGPLEVWGLTGWYLSLLMRALDVW